DLVLQDSSTAKHIEHRGVRSGVEPVQPTRHLRVRWLCYRCIVWRRWNEFDLGVLVTPDKVGERFPRLIVHVGLNLNSPGSPSAAETGRTKVVRPLVSVCNHKA